MKVNLKIGDMKYNPPSQKKNLFVLVLYKPLKKLPTWTCICFFVYIDFSSVFLTGFKNFPKRSAAASYFDCSNFSFLPALPQSFEPEPAVLEEGIGLPNTPFS